MSMLNTIHPFILFKFNAVYRALLLQVETESGRLTWWGGLLILGLIILVIVLALAWNASKTSIIEIEHSSHEEQQLAPSPSADDLTRIEGIGPKIASLLRENGINTFDRLQNAELTELRLILQNAALQFADPTTWPTQAELASKADWAALDALQKDLKGGRE